MAKRSIVIHTDRDGYKLETPVHISIKDVADWVYSYGQDLTTYNLEPDPGEDTVYGEIRLQVLAGSWEIHTGDPQYDIDHRGLWGSASVPARVSRKQARDIAVELISDIG